MDERNKAYLGTWAILSPKMAHPHNSGSAPRIFLKFCTMKRANRQKNLILLVFTKKFCSEQMGHFGPENGKSSQLWIGAKNRFKILHNERG